MVGRGDGGVKGVKGRRRIKERGELGFRLKV